MVSARVQVSLSGPATTQLPIAPPAPMRAATNVSGAAWFATKSEKNV